MNQLRFQVTGLSEDDSRETRKRGSRPSQARVTGWALIGIAILSLFGVAKLTGRVEIISPASGTTTLDAQIAVSGRTTDTGADTVWLSVNGSQPQTFPAPDGLFEVQVPLAPGENIVSASANGYSSVPIKIVRRLQPVVKITSPTGNTATTHDKIEVSGVVENSGDSAVTLDVNGATMVAAVLGDRFSTTVPLSVGRNVIRALVSEAGPSVVEVSRLETGIAITSPSDGFTTESETVTVSGTVDNSDAATITLKLNQTPQTIAVHNGSFTADVVLRVGANRIQASVGDASSNEIGVNRTLPLVIITLSSPQSGSTQSSVASVRGTIQNARGNSVTLTASGFRRIVPVTTGSFVAEVPLEIGSNVIRASQGDFVSNEVVVNRVPPPILIGITSPRSGRTQSSSVSVMGTIANPRSRTILLTVNGSPRILPITNGGFASDVELAIGDNHIRASQDDAVSNEVVVNRSAAPTLIRISSPRGGSTQNASVRVIGTITNPQGRTISLTVNGSSRTLKVINDGFASDVELEVGDNRIRASQGDSQSNEVIMRRLAPAPSIKITSPQSGRVSQSVVTVTGRVENAPGNTIRLTVNGSSSNVRVTDGSFTAEVKLSPGSNLIVASIARASDQITLVRPEGRIVIISPKDGTTITMRALVVTGRVENVETGTIALTVNGNAVRVQTRLPEFQSRVTLSPGKNLIRASLDNVASAEVTVILRIPDVPPGTPADECSKINCDCTNVRSSPRITETRLRALVAGANEPPPFFTPSAGGPPQDRQVVCRAAEAALKRRCKATGKVSGVCPPNASGPNAWPRAR